MDASTQPGLLFYSDQDWHLKDGAAHLQQIFPAQLNFSENACPKIHTQTNTEVVSSPVKLTVNIAISCGPFIYVLPLAAPTGGR